MVTVYIFTVLIIAAWAIKMLQTKKFIFRRTILDIPLLLFLSGQIITTILSIDQRTSIFGYYSRFNGGLLSTICYILLYWAFVSNFDKEKAQKLLKVTLISATLVAIWGILEHFGGSISCLIIRGQLNDNCWVQDVKTRVFASLGQPNWLAAYLIALIPLSLHFTFINKNREKILWMAISLIFFLCILFTKSRSGLLALAIALTIFGILNLKNHLKQLFTVALLFLFAVLIFGTPLTPSINNLIHQTKTTQSTDVSEGGTESGAIREIVWKGALNIWRAHPIFGTGVETFGYSYWQFRPLEHNKTSEWDYLYNKAHNEYLNFLANSGSVGLITYLILVGAIIFVLRKNSALLAGFISILITNFFGFSVVVISLLTFLIPAIAITLSIGKTKEVKKDTNQNATIAAVTVISAIILFLIARYWYADFYYQKGTLEFQYNSYESSVKDLQVALDYSPGEAIFHNQMAKVLTQTAVGLDEAKEATSAARIVPYAIYESDQAFSLSPRNMNIRQSRINIYLLLAQIYPKYLQDAIDLTNETIPLSPTDPKLELALAKAYAAMGKFKEAITYINKALQLKPDYLEAQKDLGIILKLQDKNDIIAK